MRLRGQILRQQCGEAQFNPWVQKVSRRREWPPIPVFYAWGIHGKRKPEGYSPFDVAYNQKRYPQKDIMFSTGCLLNLVQ